LIGHYSGCHQQGLEPNRQGRRMGLFDQLSPETQPKTGSEQHDTGMCLAIELIVNVS